MDFKTFRLGKDAERDYCEDSLAQNGSGTRFAVADGVSRSFRPEFVSQYLTSRFVESDISTEVWPGHLQGVVGADLQEKWSARVRDFLDGFEGLARMIQERRLQSVGPGASTFCGVTLDENSCSMDYAVLGDSCLFVLPEEGKWQVVTSCITREVETGVEVDFTYTPACLVVGQPGCVSREDWRTGSMPLAKGYIALMTDGASQWFLDMLGTDGVRASEQLWDMLDDKEAFTDYVQACRKNGTPLSDDIAIILIRIGSTDTAEDVAAPSKANLPAIIYHFPCLFLPPSCEEGLGMPSRQERLKETGLPEEEPYRQKKSSWNVFLNKINRLWPSKKN